jgi:hypothetical protein
MGRTLRRVAIVTTTALTLVVVPLAASAAPIADRTRAARAVSYLAKQQRANGSIVAFSPVGSTADAVLAFVASGTGRDRMNRALGFLRRQVAGAHVTELGLQAKVVIAVSAARRDPRSFGGTNLVRTIRSQLGSDGHFGTSAVFDDALAVLAIESVGLAPALRAASWLLAAACPDGGWAYDRPYDASTDDRHCDDGSGTDYFLSDTNTTSYVVQALIEMHAADWAGRTPFQFFSKVRSGGWPYSGGFEADANSTALVIQAYAAAGLPVPKGGMIALRKFQAVGCGAFAFNAGGPADVGATIGAVPGLLRRALPFSSPVRRGLAHTTPCP